MASKIRLYEYFGSKKHCGKDYEDFYYDEIESFFRVCAERIPAAYLGLVDHKCSGLRIKGARLIARAATWWPDSYFVNPKPVNVYCLRCDMFWKKSTTALGFREIAECDPFLFTESKDGIQIARISTIGHEHEAIFVDTGDHVFTQRELSVYGFYPDKSGDRTYSGMVKTHGKVCG